MIIDTSDIIGKKFGKLTVDLVVGRDNKKNHLYECKCDCGNKKIVTRGRLITGGTRSCGCLRGVNVKFKRPPYYYLYSRILRISGIREQSCPLSLIKSFLSLPKSMNAITAGHSLGGIRIIIFRLPIIWIGKIVTSGIQKITV